MRKKLAVIILLGIAFFIISDCYIESHECNNINSTVITFCDDFEDCNDLRYWFHKNNSSSTLAVNFDILIKGNIVKKPLNCIFDDINFIPQEPAKHITWSRSTFS